MSTSNATPAAAPPTAAFTVVLTIEQTVQLDEFAIALRRKTGSAFNRSAIIRAFVMALLPWHRNFLHCESEAELHQRIAQLLQFASARSQNQTR